MKLYSVPISSRMNELEETVKKLCESFEKFKNAPPAPASFAFVASVGAIQRTGSS